MTHYQSLIKCVPRHSSMPDNCTRTAKTRAIPSLYRDSYVPKVYGYCPVLRQLTQPPHIAGPLAVKWTQHTDNVTFKFTPTIIKVIL